MTCRCGCHNGTASHVAACACTQTKAEYPLSIDEWPEYANETDAQRYERFREGNDALWGEGNWIECPVCLDGRGKPSFHHKDMHTSTITT